MAEPKKIIIDTDPGIDDAMAIFLALRSPEIKVIGLTTIYGNVYTTLATRNALHLLEFAGRTDIPVAEGSHVSYMAIQLDPAFAKNIGQIVLLGGAFAVNGNVNPAAEANIFGDPEAADIVFTSGADVLAVGINVTHQVIMKDDERDKLAQSDGMFAKYLCKILDYYFSYHRDAYSMKGVYLHDPTALVAAINPSLMTYTEGVVRVQTTGITRGLTLFFNKQKRFEEATEWCNKPTVKVAVTVDAHAVIKLVMERLMNS
ncbi:probable uridine nucleosidase 2 isoform X2 [Cynara cardunculus var. scolymus]|uniref:probable uridine nucleosidase 2 isoform X2 n=1 Tax=Cynara cardunculus var. scolymus TaxID=59895 RepID=UPI000D62A52A|nr:probable uridine nucleosidase 2 isoform X2 [Cynara cardunculus var. scolymus]XP_024961603.1 probable uridine nucleosidase 2 isoform X2 [Cynara cardunculus var. scolymus]